MADQDWEDIQQNQNDWEDLPSTNGRLDLRQYGNNNPQDVQGLFNTLSTGLLRTNLASQVPPNTATTPIPQMLWNNLLRAGGSTIDQTTNAITSPLALMGGIGGAIGSRLAALKALQQGAKFDTLNQGEVALDAILKRKSALGAAVGNVYNGPVGNTSVDLQNFQDSINHLPKAMQTSIQNAEKTGLINFDRNADGIVPNVRNAHTIQSYIDQATQSRYFQSLEGAPQNVKASNNVADTLRGLISDSSPQVKLVNSEYSNFRTVADPVVKRMMDADTGNVNINPIRSIVENKSEPWLARNWMELRQQVPEVDQLHTTLANQARTKALKAIGGEIAKKGAEYLGAGGAMRVLGGAGEVVSDIPEGH